MRTVHEFFGDRPEIEYLDGRPFPKMSPKLTHSRVQGRLLRIIADCAADRGEILPEWRCNVGAVDSTKTEFVPDISYASHERINSVSEEEAEKPPFAPEICVEVRSPGDKIWYLREKISRCLKAGAMLVLDVNPATETIEAYSKEGTRTYRTGDMFEHPAFHWLTFDVRKLFEKPRRR